MLRGLRRVAAGFLVPLQEQDNRGAKLRVLPRLITDERETRLRFQGQRPLKNPLLGLS
jgi:hypothetical protein